MLFIMRKILRAMIKSNFPNAKNRIKQGAKLGFSKKAQLVTDIRIFINSTISKASSVTAPCRARGMTIEMRISVTWRKQARINKYSQRSVRFSKSQDKWERGSVNSHVWIMPALYFSFPFLNFKAINVNK